jgi:hypothetical protein
MRIVVFIGLLAIGVMLFLAKNWISDNTLQRLANGFAVAALIAAALVFVVPAASPPQPISERGSPEPELSSTPPPTEPTNTPIVTAVLPTSTPTATPSSTVNSFDVRDDFSDNSLDASKWERTEGEVPPIIQDGTLSLNATSTGSYVEGMVFARLNDKPIRIIETEVRITEGTYASSVGIAALVITEDKQQWYIKFGLLNNGDIFLKHGTVGQDQEESMGEWSGGGVNTPHLLRVGWTGEEVRFFADDELLKSLPSSEPGWWAALYADANFDGEIKGAFEWVGWNFR